MKKYFFTLLVTLMSLGLVQGQCAMCKATAESDHVANKGLNNGIMYLLSIPYVLMGTVGFLWFKNVRAIKKQEEIQEIYELLYAENKPQ